MYKTSSKVGMDPIHLKDNSIESNIYGNKIENPYLIQQEKDHHQTEIKNDKKSFCSIKLVFNICLILSIISVAVSLGILTELSHNEQGKSLDLNNLFSLF